MWLAEWSDVPDPPSHAELSAQTALSEIDLRRWRRYRNLARKHQFLRSRQAITLILKSDSRFEYLQFLPDQNRCPRLVSATSDHVPSISLSHSETLLAVAIDDSARPVGVDLEILSRDDISADRYNRALTSYVRNAAETSDHPKNEHHGGYKKTAHLWTIKESVWKCLGGPLDIPIPEITVCCSEPVILPSAALPTCTANQLRLHPFHSEVENVWPGSLNLRLNLLRPVAFVGCLTILPERSPRNGGCEVRTSGIVL